MFFSKLLFVTISLSSNYLYIYFYIFLWEIVLHIELIFKTLIASTIK